jgi:hypothetical protein
MQNTLKSHNINSTATTFMDSDTWKRKYTITSAPRHRECCRGSVEVRLMHYYLLPTRVCSGQILKAITFSNSLFVFMDFLKKTGYH